MRNPFNSHVFERAQELVDRRRLLLGLCAAVAVALIAAIPGVLTSAGNGKSVKTTAAQAGTTTTVVGEGAVSAEPGAPMPTVPLPGSTTTVPPSVLGTSFTQAPTTTTPKAGGKSAPPRTGTPASTAPPPKGPPPPSCRNSSEPACGPFYWDPDPGVNAPLTGQVTYSPANPKAGDTVTFHITGGDQDDSPLGVCDTNYGDGEHIVCDPIELMDPDHHCPKQYGPWTPPARKQGTLDTQDTHVYSNVGKYDVSFTVHSGSYCSSDPYASGADLTVTVIVA